MSVARLTSYALICSLMAMACTAQAEVIVPNSGTTRTPIVDGESRPFTIDALGNSSIETIRQASGGEVNYYIAPYLLYDIELFQSNVATACRGKATTDTATAALSVQFASDLVNQEVGRLASSPQTDNAKVILKPYPFGLLLLYSGYFTDLDKIEGKVRWSSPPNANEQIANGYLAAAGAFDFTKYSIDITDTCEYLSAISKGNGDFQASIYSSMPDSKRNYLSISYSLFANSDAITDLTRDESAKGVVGARSNGSSGGFGLNLGVVTIGNVSSNQSAEQTDTRQRAVTGNIIEGAIQDVSGTIIATRLKSYDFDEKGLNQIESGILTAVLTNFSTTYANFEALGDHSYKLKSDLIQETVLTKEQVEILLKSSNKPELTGSKDTSVKVDGYEGTDKTATTIKDDRQIEWQKKGDEWIPTRVKLYIVSKSKVKGTITGTFDDIALLGTVSVQKMNLVNVPTHLITEWKGPRKDVRPISGGVYKTISYWGHHFDAHHEFACLPTPSAEGYTQLGGQDTTTYDSSQLFLSPNLQLALGCRGAGHCDSAGEKCVSYARNPGCLINNEWLAWYSRRQAAAGFQPSQDEICKLP